MQKKNVFIKIKNSGKSNMFDHIIFLLGKGSWGLNGTRAMAYIFIDPTLLLSIIYTT